MHRLYLAGYLGLLLLVVALVTRPGAQTQPVAGLTATAVSAGSTGPPSLFPDGTTSAPGIAFASERTLGIWREGVATLGLRAAGANGGFRLRNDTGIIFTVGSAGVDGIWTITSGGALQNVSATSGTIVMATTTIFNASGTLTNAPCNFNDLNLLIPNAGQQCFCGNCAVGAACAAGAGGAIAKRIGGGTLSCS